MNPTTTSAPRGRLARIGLLALALIGSTLVASVPATAEAGASAMPAPLYQLEVYAGSGSGGAVLGAPALQSGFNGVDKISVDHQDNLIITSITAGQVYRINKDTGIVSLVAGRIVGGRPPIRTPTEGPAANSALDRPFGTVFDAAGNGYISDTGNRRIHKVTPDGTLSFFAGTGVAGSPVPGDALSSPLGILGDITIDAQGNLFVIDATYGLVLKVTPAGQLSIVAGGGNGAQLTPGQTQAALAADLGGISSIAVDQQGTLYLGSGTRRIFRVKDDVVSLVVGSGVSGTATPGPAAASLIEDPRGIAVDPFGNLYYAQSSSAPSNNHIWRVDSDGNQSIVAGSGPAGAAVSGPALGSPINRVFSLTFDRRGTLYLANSGTTQALRLTPTLPVRIGADVVTKTYGEDDPELSYSVEGLLPGDELTTSPTCTRQPGEDVGTYVVNCDGAAVGPAYTLVSSQPGALEIEKRSLTVTPDTQAIVYGDELPEEYPYSVTEGSLVGEDGVAGSCGVAGTPKNVGEYPITCSAVSAGPNYTLTFEPGTLSIARAMLTLRADDKERPAGRANPVFTATVTAGLVNGDTVGTAFTGAAEFSTTATTSSPIGSYPIELGKGSMESENYTFTLLPGVLRVVSGDRDGDGISNEHEVVVGTDPDDADTDGDGLADSVELNRFRLNALVFRGVGKNAKGVPIGLVRTNPLKKDTDGDGLTDGQEVRGIRINQKVRSMTGSYVIRVRVTDPTSRDADHDGLSDKQEVTGSANKRFGKAQSDPNRADTDLGGTRDGREVTNRTNPSGIG